MDVCVSDLTCTASFVLFCITHQSPHVPDVRSAGWRDGVDRCLERFPSVGVAKRGRRDEKHWLFHKRASSPCQKLLQG